MKYTNTRPVPVRLVTSKGIVPLDGMTSIELDELIKVPDFVQVEGAPKPEKKAPAKPAKKAAAKPAKKPVTTTQKPKKTEE